MEAITLKEKMKTISFHKTKFGRFGHNLPCDIDGYVHLTTEAWLSAPVDWGQDHDEESKAERAEEMAQEAIEATERAEAALIEWQEEK